MTELQRITEAFEEIVKPDKLQNWLNTVHKQFSDKSPRQLIEEGKHDQIWQIYWFMRGY